MSLVLFFKRKTAYKLRISDWSSDVCSSDLLMQTGFTWATRAGISFGKDDMVIPAAKTRLVDAEQARVKEFEQQYQDGLITQGEKYNKVIEALSEPTDKVADEKKKEIQADKPDKPSQERRLEGEGRDDK